MTTSGDRPCGEATPARDAGLRSLLVATLLAAGLFLLWQTRDVVALLFAGLLVGIFLAALADGIHARLAVPRLAGLVGIVAMLIAGLASALVLAGPQLGAQLTELQERLPRAAASVREQVEATPVGRFVLDRVPDDGIGLPEGGTLVRRATGIASATLGAFGSLFVVLLFGLFVAARPTEYRDGILRLVAPARRSRLCEVLTAATDAMRRWIISKVIRMFFIGVATWVALRVLGVPVAGLLAIAAALLTFIPNFGPIIAATPAILLAVTEGVDTAVWVAGLYLAIQFLEGNVLDPILTRMIVALPPALALGAQVVLGVLCGPVGLAIATPLVAGGVVLVRGLYVEDRLEAQAQT